MMFGSFFVKISKMSRRCSFRILVLIVLVVIGLVSLHCTCTDRTPAARHRIRRLNRVDNIRYFERIPGHDYGYIHNPRNMCRSDDGRQESIFLLFLVMTSPGEIERREAIRATYANESNWPVMDEGEVRTVFLVGEVNNYIIQDFIDGEMYHYGDIVQSTVFVDDYLNRTRKIKMGFQWVEDHCRHARYVMKIEEHAMVNQKTFLKLLRQKPSRKKYIFGDVLNNVKVSRNKMSLDYIPYELYPNATLPPYLSGAGYILSTDLVGAVLQESSHIHVFPHADAYIGLCLQKTGVKLIKTADVTFSLKFNYVYPKASRDVIKMFDKSLALSFLTVGQMYYLWRLGEISCTCISRI